MKVALPVPAHFAGMDHQLEDMQVAVIRAGLPEQEKRRRKEMSFIHNFGSLAPWGLDQKERMKNAIFGLFDQLSAYGTQGNLLSRAFPLGAEF